MCDAVRERTQHLPVVSPSLSLCERCCYLCTPACVSNANKEHRSMWFLFSPKFSRCMLGMMIVGGNARIEMRYFSHTFATCPYPTLVPRSFGCEQCRRRMQSTNIPQVAQEPVQLQQRSIVGNSEPIRTHTSLLIARERKTAISPRTRIAGFVFQATAALLAIAIAGELLFLLSVQAATGSFHQPCQRILLLCHACFCVCALEWKYTNGKKKPL